MGVQTGLERIAQGDRAVTSRFVGKRVGLLCHPASVDSRLRNAADVFQMCGIRVTARFGPEHGISGAAQDMIGVDSDYEDCPVYSLYGGSETDLSPRPEWLRNLDVIVIDLQDVGSRYYTYVWTAALMLKAAARLGIPTVVLDRPNPLGGDVVEGAPQRPGYRSFVGHYDVAVRHGMTIGEIATMVASLERLDREALEVVPMLGYSRSMYFDDTGLPWVLPSPNMPTLDTAIVYPGGCLLEGTNLSEGRGVTRPFEIFGAPFVDGGRLRDGLAIPGATLRPLTFEPTFHKHARLPCGGVQVHVHDRSAFQPYEAYLRILFAIRSHHPDQFRWRTEPYEFVHDRPAIDLLTGGPEFREATDLGEVLEFERRGAEEFQALRRPFLIYAE